MKCQYNRTCKRTAKHRIRYIGHGVTEYGDGLAFVSKECEDKVCSNHLRVMKKLSFNSSIGEIILVVAIQPLCLYCEKPLKLAPKYIRERGRAITADGMKPEYGYEGNNAVCSSRCGFLVAVALLRADPYTQKLLPKGWNKKSRRDV